MRPSWAILGYLGVLLSRPVGRCWAVLGPSKSDAKTRLRKPPFLEDVSSEIAIGRVRSLGPPMPTPSALPPVLLSRKDRTRSALSVIPGSADADPLGTPPGFIIQNGSHAKRAFRYLSGTRRKALLFLRGCGIAGTIVLKLLGATWELSWGPLGNRLGAPLGRLEAI